MTQSYGKSPYSTENSKKQSDNIKFYQTLLDYTTIADRLMKDLHAVRNSVKVLQEWTQFWNMSLDLIF